MAQSGYTPISLYYSATGAAVPIAGNLVDGELALNTNDGKLYFKNSSGVVTLLAGSSSGPAGGSTTQVQYNNAGVLAGITGATTNGTALTLVAPVLGTPASGVATNLTGLPVATGISGLGTGVATALAVNVGSAGAFVALNGALGTPSSGTLTNVTGLPVTSLVSGTLGENVDFNLDAALSADGKYCGITESGTSAAALSFGEVIYRVTASGKWAKAKADVASTSSLELGICVLAAGGADATITVLKYGKVRADALYPTFTVGAPVYISAATAGLPTSTAPTGTTNFVVRIIGHGEDGNTIFFAPSPDYLELA